MVVVFVCVMYVPHCKSGHVQLSGLYVVLLVSLSDTVWDVTRVCNSLQRKGRMIDR